jgi:hypothetical protein
MSLISKTFKNQMATKVSKSVKRPTLFEMLSTLKVTTSSGKWKCAFSKHPAVISGGKEM